MFIERIQIKNIMMFKDVDINFDKDVNIFVGANGCGKSIFLQIIYYVLTQNENKLLEYVNENSKINIILKLSDDEIEKLIWPILIQYMKNLQQSHKIDKKILNNIEQAYNLINNIDKLKISMLYINDLHKYEMNINLLNDDYSPLSNINDIFTKFNFITVDKQEVLPNEILKEISRKYKINNDYLSKLYHNQNHPSNYINSMIKDNLMCIEPRTNNIQPALLYKIFNDDYKLYEKITRTFRLLTNKTITIRHINYNKPKEKPIYVYSLIGIMRDYQVCSYGEEELINFIVSIYSSKYNILLVDEIVPHISSQLKCKFINLFNEIIKDKQLFLITHDIEYTRKYIGKNNIVYFSNRNNKGYINSNTILNPIYFDTKAQSKDISIIRDQKIKNNSILLDAKDIKILIECPEILFSKKCLFVEGYYDKMFYSFFCNFFEINDYLVISVGGKSALHYEICERLNIGYKLIYDRDVLETNHTNKKNIEIAFDSIKIGNKSPNNIHIINGKYGTVEDFPLLLNVITKSGKNFDYNIRGSSDKDTIKLLKTNWEFIGYNELLDAFKKYNELFDALKKSDIIYQLTNFLKN